jgi:endonuclease YncB( thermonuclease family)
MSHTIRIRGIVAALLLACITTAALAGDSLYGKVVDVERADRVTLDYGGGRYELTLAAIEIPRDDRAVAEARRFVAELVLGRNARMRFEGRTENGEMLARLYTDDPERGIREVNVELVRAGLARRAGDADFKYGELAAAEREARAARRGVWATSQPR